MSTYSILERQILELINRYRAEKGLPALQFNDKIQAVSRRHSQAMAQGLVSFGHEGFKQRADELMPALSGISIGENVAKGQQSAESVVQSWLDSPPHRKNIEDDYQLTGIAVEQDSNGEPLFTQIFLRIKQNPVHSRPNSEPQLSPMQMAGALMSKIQAYRQGQNLAVLQTEAAVQRVAQQFAGDMASGKQPYGNEGFKDRVLPLIQALGGRTAAENVMRGSGDADAILEQWLQSAAHRKNLDSNYRFTGLGAAQSADGTWFFAQIFIG